MSYGSRISSLNATAQSLSAKAGISEESYRDDLINKSRDAENLARTKSSNIESIATELTQPLLGASQVYQTAKALRKSAMKVKDGVDKLRTQFTQPEGEQDVGFNPSELPSQEPSASVSETSFSSAEPKPVGSGYEPEEDEFTNSVLGKDTGNALSDAGFNEEDAEQMFSSTLEGGDGEQLSGTTSKLASALSDTSGDLVSSTGDAIGATATDVLADVGASQVLDAIPVVGEISAVVGGLVAGGEAIYSLVHHTSTPAPPKLANPSAFLVGSDVQQKYASDIPSLDTSVDRSGGEGIF